MKHRRKKGGGLYKLLALCLLLGLFLWLFRGKVEKWVDSVQRAMGLTKGAGPADEKILEGERKQLEEILKKHR